MLGIEPNHEERRAGGDPEPPPLADGVVDDAVVAAEHRTVHVHDLARPDGARLQLLHDVAVAALGNEADVLAVVLVGDGKTQLARQRARLVLGEVAEREAQEIELVLRRGEKEIALVAVEVGRAEQRAAAADGARAHVMAGRHRRGVELARRGEQVGELDRLVAGDAGDRRLASGIALRERLDDGLAEARLVVEHVMRDAEPRRHLAGIVDVAAGAAGARAVRGAAVVVELQRHADDVVAGLLHEPGDDGGIDAARHGDDDARRGTVCAEAEIDVHHCKLLRRRRTITDGTLPARANTLPNLKEFQGRGLAEF